MSKKKQSIKTTLCYIERDGAYLMMLRNKKEHDLNEGKWIGVGGKFKRKESPEECLLREVKEETGLTLKRWHFYGVVSFRSNEWDAEDMYLYSADEFEGDDPVGAPGGGAGCNASFDASGSGASKSAAAGFESSEGELAWIPKSEIMGLNLWEGDRLFLQKMLDGEKRFSMTLSYEGDNLVSAVDWCANNGFCGGCTYGGCTYEEQSADKERKLVDLLTPAFDQDTIWEGVVKSPLRTAYKNKMEYSFGDEIKDGPLTLGMHRKKSFYSVLTCDDCRIVHNDFNKIVRASVDFFGERGIPYVDKRSHEGYLRHLLVRRSFANGDVMVDLVTKSKLAGEATGAFAGEAIGACEAQVTGEAIGACEAELLEEWKNCLLGLKLEGQISGILHTKNDSLADAVIDEGTDIIYGRDFIEEELLGLRFKITPFSFFQTNSKGAEALYAKVREYVGDTAGQVVYDLYCGTGTIAQIVAPAAKKAYGVEIVAEAVTAARENAKLNGLSNCEFIAGDVLEVLSSTSFEKPDMIILDPPRDGLHPKMLPVVCAYGVKNIVYVACKPASFVRDMEYFKSQGYIAVKACGVDQFPWTKHVECVVLMSRVEK